MKTSNLKTRTLSSPQLLGPVSSTDYQSKLEPPNFKMAFGDAILTERDLNVYESPDQPAS